MRMGTWAIVLAMSGSYPSAKGYREREMSKKAAAKIIAGLEDAVAYAKGDESRVRVTTILSPKHSVIERLAVANCRALWEAAVERPGEDNVDELSARTISRELATILREMPEELKAASYRAFDVLRRLADELAPDGRGGR